MSTGRQLTLFDRVPPPKRLKTQTSYSGSADGSNELEEAIDPGTEPEGGYGDGDDRGLGNHQDITINKPRGPKTIVLDAASNIYLQHLKGKQWNESVLLQKKRVAEENVQNSCLVFQLGYWRYGKERDWVLGGLD